MGEPPGRCRGNHRPKQPAPQTAIEHEDSFERNENNDPVAEIEWHYNRVGATLPSFFQDAFVHDPASFNPMRLLTSSVACADG